MTMADVTTIYHITDPQQWQKALARGQYVSETFSEEGFIHFSMDSQVLSTANRYYSGVSGLILIKVNVSKLASELKFELSPSGDVFPHLYGPLNLDAVEAVYELTVSPNGKFLSLPFENV